MTTNSSVHLPPQCLQDDHSNIAFLQSSSSLFYLKKKKFVTLITYYKKIPYKSSYIEKLLSPLPHSTILYRAEKDQEQTAHLGRAIFNYARTRSGFLTLPVPS